MTWKKTGREVKANGESTTYYSNGTYDIESRKRAIPHANGRGGYWMYTSYFLISPDGTEKEYHTLKDAKEAANDNP